MNGKHLILILVGVIIISGCVANQIGKLDEKEIISTFTEHQMSIEDYSGIVLIESGLGGDIEEQYRIYVKYPDKFKTECLLSSKRHSGIITIVNGNEYIRYDPVYNNTLMAETNLEGNCIIRLDYQGLLKKIIPMGNITYSGIDYIDNRPAYLIEIRLEKPDDILMLKCSSSYQFSLAKVWVDPESWIVKKIELYYPDRVAPEVTLNYQDLLVNRGISDNVFSLEQYLQYEIVTPAPPPHPSHVFYEIG